MSVYLPSLPSLVFSSTNFPILFEFDPFYSKTVFFGDFTMTDRYNADHRLIIRFIGRIGDFYNHECNIKIETMICANI